MLGLHLAYKRDEHKARMKAEIGTRTIALETDRLHRLIQALVTENLALKFELSRRSRKNRIEGKHD
jgi:hypothetical protein